MKIIPGAEETLLFPSPAYLLFSLSLCPLKHVLYLPSCMQLPPNSKVWWGLGGLLLSLPPSPCAFYLLVWTWLFWNAFHKTWKISPLYVGQSRKQKREGLRGSGRLRTWRNPFWMYVIINHHCHVSGASFPRFAFIRSLWWGGVPACHLIQRQSGFKTCDTVFTLSQAAREHLFLGARWVGTQQEPLLRGCLALEGCRREKKRFHYS